MRLDKPGQDKPTNSFDYASYMLDLFKEDIKEFIGPQHEGCYRVDILERKIEELAELYLAQIRKDKIKNSP